MSFNLKGVKAESDIGILYNIVGFIVVQWGFAEQSLDLMVANIFHYFDGHVLLKNRPINLGSKLKFLKECFNKIPELTEFRKESEELFLRFENAGIKRNDIVHGAILDITKKDGAFMFLKIDVKPTKYHSQRLVLLTESEWPVFQKELLDLGRDGQSFTHMIWNRFKV
ncbi:hypothetical protein [Nitrosomonas sp. Nm34]|uniref:hypothetical protein n=1 Tax=Nitrosomonas sp. Nm34 TaxID=1881055 RepID=UPI0008DF117E|nr:hypothetical protein [Nitrosomonas sp. Nm34]SFI39654.1 hypothetical protein SAMN05428978_100856 [Nitrosomonas sp. Nm34]